MTTPPYKPSDDKLAMLDKLVSIAKPHVKEIRGKQYPIVDFVALVEFVQAEIATAVEQAQVQGAIDELALSFLDTDKTQWENFGRNEVLTVKQRKDELYERLDNYA